MMRANYHTHTWLCRHAVGTPSDYAEAALACGMKTLGISDHAPFEELRDRSVRMFPEELPRYLRECDEAITAFAGRLRILKGLEIEYFEDREDFYIGLRKQMDYLALGQHYVDFSQDLSALRSVYRLSGEEGLAVYSKTLVKAMSTGLFKFVCHPDLMLFGTVGFDESAKRHSVEIIEAAKKFDVPLEINANGIRRGMYQYPEGNRYVYPRWEFWKLVKEVGARVIISADAHHPDLLCDGAIGEARRFARGLELEVEEELGF